MVGKKLKVVKNDFVYECTLYYCSMGNVAPRSPVEKIGNP